jgi:hypothetical protein
MQTLARWWRQWTVRSARQAWGLAPQKGAWALVGLVRHRHGLIKVHTSLTLATPPGLEWTDLRWLSPILRENGRLRGGLGHRLNVALAPPDVQEGTLDLPSHLPAEDRLYEVQWEVSRALALAPEAVNFDFTPMPLTEGPGQRVHWMGCAQTHLVALKNCTRAAGWRLAAAESERQAAQRGLRALLGGSASLLTQAPQDWQFRAPSTPASTQEDTPPDSEDTLAQAIQGILNTPTGARLVASGLALRAWH